MIIQTNDVTETEVGTITKYVARVNIQHGAQKQ